jgi:hypothetical protein
MGGVPPSAAIHRGGFGALPVFFAAFGYNYQL